MREDTIRRLIELIESLEKDRALDWQTQQYAGFVKIELRNELMLLGKKKAKRAKKK